MDRELNPEAHQVWLSAIQILVHSEQLFEELLEDHKS